MRLTFNTSARRRTRRTMRFAATALTGFACLLLLPALANAQAIGGTVSDSTGGVLPGVTVEARSPGADRAGADRHYGRQRAVPDRRARDRHLHRHLHASGLQHPRARGIELSTGFTANIDAQLAVGALEETVTVTEATPVIDVQNVARNETIDREIYEALPTSRTYDAMALLIPAMNVQGARRPPSRPTRAASPAWATTGCRFTARATRTPR